MSTTALSRGVLVLVGLDPTLGHEQRHLRPCVVLVDATTARRFRYPLFTVVPLTGTTGLDALYPVLLPSPTNGLTKPSSVLVDNLRAIDPVRIRGRIGALDAPALAAISAALRVVLGL